MCVCVWKGGLMVDALGHQDLGPNIVLETWPYIYIYVYIYIYIFIYMYIYIYLYIVRPVLNERPREALWRRRETTGDNGRPQRPAPAHRFWYRKGIYFSANISRTPKVTRVLGINRI